MTIKQIVAQRKAAVKRTKVLALKALKHEMSLPVYKASVWGRVMGKKRNANILLK